MKVLIGTPIHEVKNYCVHSWLQNVCELLAISDVDLLLVDNSTGLGYAKKLKTYCEKLKIKRYTIVHLKWNQGMKLLEKCARIEAAQKLIREYVLSHNYDAWFSWECDQLIPPDSLEKLTNLMTTNNLMVVAHNSWTRGSSTLYNMDMGITLIKKEALQKHHWQGDGEEVLFKERVFRSGGNYANVYGLFNVHHLDNQQYLDDQI